MDQNVNIPLLRKAVEWAEAEAAKPAAERQWEQLNYVETQVFDREINTWVPTSCGTAYCIAGYVGQLLDDRYANSSAHPVTGVHVEEFARDALGLDRCEADSLFRGDNTIEDVRRAAEDIAGERL